MRVFAYLLSLFGKDWSLDSLSLAALKEERLGLDNEVRRLGGNLQHLETQAEQLRAAYETHVNEGRKSHQDFVVREYQDIQEQIRSLQARHARTQNWLRVTSTLVMLKEDETLVRQRGRGSILSMNLVTLKAHIETALARQGHDMAQLTDLLQVIESEQKRVSIVQDAGQIDVRDELDAWVAMRAQDGQREIDSELAEINRELATRERIRPAVAPTGAAS